ncbi:MAG: hypothetical protein ACM34J_15390 [Ignavibacteria bacterium]
MSGTQINLITGLLKYEPGWKIVLDQIGTPWETIDNTSDISSSSFSVIIANKVPDENEKEILDRYLLDGGSILTQFESGRSFIKSNLSRKKINSLAAGGEQFNTFDLLDIFNSSIINKYEPVTTLEREGCGTIAHIPFPVNEVITKINHKRKNFYFRSERLPNEVVRLQSLGSIRRFLFSVLEFLHHRRGIPFIHTWFFPRNVPSVFTFRIDSDKGSRDEIDDLYKLLDRFEIPGSWFLDVKSHEEWMSYFKIFHNQELGIHCYEHATYNSFEKNFNNFFKAAEILKKNNIEFKGFAAPLGRWNYFINDAAEKIGFTYSSEFGFDYDNLPSFPWLSQRFSNILQLPVHPICAGSMRRVQFSKEQMLEYFIDYIQKQIDLREPVCLYHHPTHHYNEVFESVFGYINRQNIIKLSYSQYAEWWIKRLSAKPRFIWDITNKNIHAETSGTNEDVWYRVCLPGNKEVILPLNCGEFSVSSFNSVEQKKIYKAPSDLFRIRKFDRRHIIYNLLDYWYSIKS